MAWLRARPLPVFLVGATLAGIAAVFAFARPTYHPERPPEPPDSGLSYTQVSYTAADARRAFAAVGIVLSPRSQTPTVTTLGNRGDILEVDAFGARAKVEQSGFSDYAEIDGRYVHYPRACAPGTVAAERWRGNVRVIVDCAAAGPAPNLWLRRAERALARL